MLGRNGKKPGVMKRNMSDLENADTNPVAAAAAQMDRIRHVAEKMTVASSETRRILFQLTKAPINELLAINRDSFDDRESIRGRIAILAKALLTLRNQSNGQILEDRSDGFGDCPVCSTAIIRHQNQSRPKPDDPWKIFCPTCCQEYSQALENLSVTGVGFGTGQSLDQLKQD